MTDFLKHTILIGVMLFGWFLFGIAVIDYILGNIFNMFPTQKSSQMWGCFLGFLMSVYQTRKWATPWISENLGPWWTEEDGSAARFKKTIGLPFIWLGRILLFIYTNIRLIGGYAFFGSLAVATITTIVGLVFIDGNSFFGVLIFYILLALIGFMGLRSNLVRLVVVFGFFKMWLSTQSPFLYIFQLPIEIEQLLAVLFPEFFQTIVIVICIGLLVYFGSIFGATTYRYLGDSINHDRQTRTVYHEKIFDKFSFENRFFLGALFCIFVLFIIFINFMIDIINIDLYMASILIIVLDSYGREYFSKTTLLSDRINEYLAKKSPDQL